MIHRLIEFSLKNRVLVGLGALLLIGLGVKSLVELPVDVYPDLNAPIVNVMTESHGMAPEEMETLITFPLESAFNSLPYVNRVRSNSALGLSKITIEFEYGTDIYFARQLVTEKLQMMTPLLPEDVDPPFIGPISSMFADAVEFTLEGDDLYELRDFAEWTLKPRLQTVPGVSNVINLGGFVKQYQVLLNPDRMLAFGVHPHDVVKALQDNNHNSSGGFLLHGPEERIIRGIGRIRNLEDIESVVLKHHNGVPVTVAQVADVKIGPYVRRGTAGESGKEVVIVSVKNQYHANVMETIRGVEEVLDDIEANDPHGLTFKPFYNQLDMIIKSIRNVTGAIFLGAVLVILVLYLFLSSLRSTLVVALAIPLSAVFSFLFFRFLNLTLNIMTLGGLAIGLGMIVDSSIIMAENIHRHLQENRSGGFMAAVMQGAQEVGRPIFFAVLILLSVFGPIFTLQGMEGRMFIPLTFAVSAAVMGSLIISLTITPVLATLLFKKVSSHQRTGRLMPFLKKFYNPMLEYALTHARKLGIVCVGIVLLAGLLSLFTGSEFMPEMDESSLLVDVLLPPETSLDESSRIASLVAKRVSEIPEVLRVVRATGKARGDEHSAPVNLTHSNCVLIPKEKRHASIEEIKEKIRHATHDIPGVMVQINAPLQHRINHVATGTRSAIAVKIFGDNMGTLSHLSVQVEAAMKGVRGVTDLQVEPVSGVPQLQIRLDRQKLARYGLNVSDVSHFIETALNGVTATELVETRKRYDIFVRYQETYRDSEEKIRHLLMETPDGYRIPLSEVAQVTEDRHPSIFRRENGIRRAMVQCNVSGRDMGSVVGEIKSRLSGLDWPEGYFFTFGGTYESQIRALRQLTAVVILTVAVVFCLLVVSFKSVKHALLILINIPLALAGGVMILFITGSTLSVPSLVGFIALIGIAVQDGIVLITHINRYRGQGLAVREAVIKAGNNKLRPVLMTTFTTMLGLVPLAFGQATGSEIQKPLAFVIMFGLLFSTLLTLVVLPALYTAFEGRREA